MSVDVLLATCKTLPEPDPDAAPLEAALTAAGLSWRWAVWNDPGEGWRAPATLIRSTWDYLHDPSGFAAWAERADAAGRLSNSARVVRWNLHKGYLTALADAGLAVVPTVVFRRGEPADPVTIAHRMGWEKVVVKPAVSAGSFGTHAFAVQRFDRVTFDALHRQRDVLLQPYVESVHDYGERSLVWIDGAITHAVRKAPRFSADAEQIDGPMPIEAAETALAEKALAVVRAQVGEVLYARFDLVRDRDGAPMIAEIELIEPSLFFAKGAGAVERLVAGLVQRLG